MRDDLNIQFAAQNLLEDMDETSVSSGVGAYQARTGMSGKDTYKKNKGERTSGGMIYKNLWEAEVGERVRVSPDKFQVGGETGTIEQVRGGFVVVKMDSDGKSYSLHSSDVTPFEDDDDDLDEVFVAQDKDKVEQLLDKLKQIDYSAYRKLLMAMVDPKPYEYDDAEKELTGKLALSENYSKFKNETKTRSKADQFHQAIREVKKRVEEIHKVFEYVNRLEGELNEDGDGLKYKKHTEAAMSKIQEMVSELGAKMKKFQMKETQLRSSTPTPPYVREMERLNLDGYISVIISKGFAKDMSHFINIMKKKLSTQPTAPTIKDEILNYAINKYKEAQEKITNKPIILRKKQ